jgi:hypothetical protein
MTLKDPVISNAESIEFRHWEIRKRKHKELA